MEFTHRIRQILSELLEERDVLTVKELAERIGISRRTVQRELNYIGTILKRNNLTLNSKTGAGIWIEGSEDDRNNLKKLIASKETQDVQDKNERRKLLTLELLKDQTPKKLYFYANLFDVSEATIGKDMDSIEEWFEKFNLTIFRRQGFGVYLQGEEQNLRLAIREFISENIKTPALQKLYLDLGSELKTVGMSSTLKGYEILNEEILKRVLICFASISDQRLKNLTEESYVGLLLHVTIAIERVLAGETIAENSRLQERFKDSDGYSLAVSLVSSLENEFNVEIPDSEIAFICLHIQASKLQYGYNESLPDSSAYDLDKIVGDMILAYDEEKADLLSSDEELIQGLKVHMGPTIVRLQNNLPIENPHLEDIKSTYSEVYERCLHVAKVVESHLGYDLPQAEIGYLTIHFGAAMLRIEHGVQQKRSVNIGLVCVSGMGISRLMLSRLNLYLGDRVHLTAYGNENITEESVSLNDFFVSNMELGNIKAEVVKVNPLLPPEDLMRIEAFVNVFEKTPPKPKKGGADFMERLETVETLSKNMLGLLRNFKVARLPKGVDFNNMLALSAKMCLGFGGVEHIIDKGVSKEVIEKRIVEELRRREELSSQVVEDLGIGLFHGMIEGIKHPLFFIGVADSGQPFENPYFKGIDACIMLLIPNDEKKLISSRMMGKISEALVDDEIFLRAVRCGDGEAARRKLEEIMRVYISSAI